MRTITTKSDGAFLARQKVGVLRKILRRDMMMNVRYLVSMPFIYGVIVPTLFLHVVLEIYHRVCFRLYGIPRVCARDYFVFDRARLPYLNWLEKFNCLYCSYFNGFIAYAREVAARTERYWCPIKHARAIPSPHGHYRDFVAYDDGEQLRRRWSQLRRHHGYVSRAER